ncbi:hypothetical protein NE237_007120 [Protea cynaroides]|uniref:Uncharacterized protein n=1 Tax=Protea cynaroides TaxID=273540 RepID=A0A9Q0KNU8_9MAGN|nr:hypothetical protein NE237_007120 [Protea cynaroides]
MKVTDCELIKGSFGKIRDQWVKASSRKQSSEDIHNSQFVVEEQGSGYGSHLDNQNNVEVKNESEDSEQEKETPIHSDSNNFNNRKENLSSYTVSKPILVDDSSLNPKGYNPVEDLDPTALGQESPSWSETQPHRTQFSERNYDPWRGPFNYESAFFNYRGERCFSTVLV